MPSPNLADASPVPMPAPLRAGSLDEFRRTLAGLSEPSPPDDMTVDKAVREDAVSFVGVLADLHQRSGGVDPIKVWEHVVKALNIAASACDGRDFAAFACHCLPPLGVEPETAAYDEAFGRYLEQFPADDLRGIRIIKYLSGPMQVAAVAFARNRRKEGQAARADARADARAKVAAGSGSVPDPAPDHEPKGRGLSDA